MKSSLFFRFPAIILCLSLWLFLSGCDSGSSVSSTEPPVFSPLQVLVPEAPGKETIGSSPLVLDISEKNQGYLTAESDSSDSSMNLQISTPTEVLYSYFISPGETAVIPFSEGNGDYTITCYQQVSGDQYAALYMRNSNCGTLPMSFCLSCIPTNMLTLLRTARPASWHFPWLTEDTEDLEALELIYDYVTDKPHL